MLQVLEKYSFNCILRRRHAIVMLYILPVGAGFASADEDSVSTSVQTRLHMFHILGALVLTVLSCLLLSLRILSYRECTAKTGCHSLLLQIQDLPLNQVPLSYTSLLIIIAFLCISFHIYQV